MKKIHLIIIGIILLAVVSIIIINNVKNNNKQFLVTFDSNGGTLIETVKVKRNALVSKPKDPEKEGFVFLGWTESGKAYDFNKKITKNITLVAKYEIKKENVENFIIKFDTDGGSAILNQVVEKNANIKKPEEPVREGYIFKGWYLDDKEYNFDSPVIKNLTLKARWEKEKSSNNNSNNNSNNKTNDNSNNNLNNNSSSNLNNLELSTPTLTADGIGVSPDVSARDYKISNIDFADGIEIYKSTDGKNYTLENSLTKSELSNKGNKINTVAYVGEHNYYKVCAYKNVNGKKVYSEYSKIVDVTGPTLGTPTLTADGMGVSPDVSARDYKISNIDFADGIEIYKSTDGKNYTLESSLTKSELSNKGNKINTVAYVGEQNYYKLRAYKNVNGKKIYSEYSKIVEITGPTLKIPTLTEVGTGGDPEEMSRDYKISNVDFADGIEIYKSTDGKNYTLENSLTKSELSNKGNKINTVAYVGEHNYYKVRAYKNINGKKVYSEYSKIVDVECS